MRYISLLVLAIFVFACNFNQPKRGDSHSSLKTNLPVDPAKIGQLQPSSVATYRQVLDTLDQGDLASIDIAGTLFSNCLADTLTRDSLFVAYQDFLERLAANYPENNEKVSLLLDHSPAPEALTPLKSALASHGIFLGNTEGDFWLEPQSGYLLKNFGPVLSAAYREFLSLETKEQQERLTGNGKMLMPADSLISRLLIWESFVSRYPGFISIRKAYDQYAQYLGAYLAGREHSGVFDPGTNLLNDSSRTSFESFIIQNPGTRSAEVVKGYLDLLKSSDFRYTEKVDSFLLEKVYGSEMGGESKQ